MTAHRIKYQTRHGASCVIRIIGAPDADSAVIFLHKQHGCEDATISTVDAISAVADYTFGEVSLKFEYPPALFIKPTLNLNGSSVNDLIEPRLKSMGHLMDAISALSRVTPNGRDYPADRERCTHDRDLHFARIEKIKALYSGLIDEALYIKDQGK
jgi:hypothetical protein